MNSPSVIVCIVFGLLSLALGATGRWRLGLVVGGLCLAAAVLACVGGG